MIIGGTKNFCSCREQCFGKIIKLLVNNDKQHILASSIGHYQLFKHVKNFIKMTNALQGVNFACI